MSKPEQNCISRAAYNIAGEIFGDAEGTLIERIQFAIDWQNKGTDGDLTDGDRRGLSMLLDAANGTLIDITDEETGDVIRKATMKETCDAAKTIAAEEAEDDEITESRLFIDDKQNEKRDGRAYGFIGVNGMDNYQGWFFSWPYSSPAVTTAAQVQSVIDSLDADEMHANAPQIPLAMAEAKLAKFLAKFPLTQKITISRDGVWAGEGKLDAGKIENCSAVLGVDQDASDETYAAIQDAIEAGDESVERPDGEYAWTIED